MEFTNHFRVPAGVQDAWELLGDLPRVATCLPGATVDSLEGDRFTGHIGVRVGPIKAAYNGQGTVSTRDEAAHRMVIDAAGKEGSGKGSAKATITLQLQPDGASHTTVDVHTALDITGKVAQFGRRALADVNQRMLDQFAANLAELCAPEADGSGEVDRAGAHSATSQPSSSDAIGLATVLPPAVVRMAPAVLGFLAGVGLTSVVTRVLRRAASAA